MKRLFVILNFVWILSPAISNASEGNNVVWLSKLKDAYAMEKERIIQALKSNMAWYVKYSMDSKVIVNSKTQTIRSDGETYFSGKIKYVKADGVEIYMDEKDVFTVSNGNKTVFRSASSKKKFVIENIQYYNFFNDSFEKNYRVVGCRKDSSSSLIKYDIQPINPEKAQFRSMAVYLDNQDVIQKVHVEMNPQLSSQLQSYDFRILERSRQPEKNWKSVEDRILYPSGKLKPPYSNYSYKNLSK